MKNYKNKWKKIPKKALQKNKNNIIMPIVKIVKYLQILRNRGKKE